MLLANVGFMDNGKIMTGNQVSSLTFTPEKWYKVTVTVELDSNSFRLQIEDASTHLLIDVGTFPADPDGGGTNLSKISRLGLASDHAGRECWFDDVTVTNSRLITGGLLG